MMYTLITMLLAAAGASTGAARKQKAITLPVQPEASAYAGGGASASSSSKVSTSGTGYSYASSECSSSSYSSAMVNSAGKYAAQVSVAIENVCTYNIDVYSLKKAYEDLYTWATAYAQAQADAQCHTKQYGGGVAYGCGWSNAQSYATTEAYSEAHALTVKKILGKYCSCLNKDVLVFASSDLALELLATAHSQANAHVCASGNQHAYAASYVKCYAHITAKLFVKSLIGSVADAKCWRYSHDVDAYAGVIAEVYADLDQYEYCDTDSYAVIHGHGNGGYNHAGGHSSGGAYTDSELTTPQRPSIPK